MNTEQDPGQPVHPPAGDVGQEQPDDHMTLRDKFAIEAMRSILMTEEAMDRVGITAKNKKISPFTIVARMSYKMAGEMMKARRS